MKPTITVDFKKFNAYTREMARATGGSLPQITRREAASVIKVAASLHKNPTQAKIKQQTAQRTIAKLKDGSARIRLGKNRRVWFFPNGTGSKAYLMGVAASNGVSMSAWSGWRIPNNDWARFNNMLSRAPGQVKENTRRALASRGSVQRSYIQILRAMGENNIDAIAPFSARIPAYALRAIPRDGKLRNNGSATQMLGGGTFRITAINRSPLAIRNEGQAKVNRAIARRRAAFKSALRAGVFQSATATAARYPGIQVKTGPA